MAIQIDLTGFVHPHAASTDPLLIFIGPPGEVFITTPLASVDLPPGGYEVIVASAVVADVTFTVTAQGTVEFDASFDTFMSGRGTSTLAITGFEITFDARYLSGPTTLFVLPDPVQVLNTRIRLLPAHSYELEQGSGSVEHWPLTITRQGSVEYDPAFDIAQGGFLAGRGTSNLQLLGYPLLVDARASGASSVGLVPTGNVTFSSRDVTFVNLLPTDQVALQLDNVRLPFVLDLNGHFHVAPAQAHLARFDHFHGLARMTVLQPLG
ncbi:MAG: hypothetical protein JO023_25730 [Chloroflexi bacterium]|nr:hypothetical protein [Chloroflexota bacterium]